MIYHVWSVLCSRSSTDKETNNVSLFDVIEQLNVLAPDPIPDGAGIPIQSELVTLWSRENPEEPGRTGGRVRLLSPNASVAFAQEFDINLLEHHRVRTQLRMNGFPLRGFGRYLLVVEQRQGEDAWREVARIPIQLERLTQPQA